MRGNECENRAIFTRKSRDFHANLLHVRFRNGGGTRKARVRSRAICGALSHRSISKRGHFFSQAPGFSFFRIFKNIATIPTL